MKRIWKRSVCLMLTLVLCAGLLSALTVGAAAESLEERQQAVVTLAWAYYDKGHSVQYDGATINRTINRNDIGKTRSTNQVAPEFATPNETMYTVCWTSRTRSTGRPSATASRATPAPAGRAAS